MHCGFVSSWGFIRRILATVTMSFHVNLGLFEAVTSPHNNTAEAYISGGGKFWINLGPSRMCKLVPIDWHEELDPFVDI